jgi:hypothetical protein
MKEGETIIDKTPASEAIKRQQIVGWIIKDDEMIKEINLGIEKTRR